MLLLALAGCANPGPPPQLYGLRAAPPVAAVAPLAGTQTLQLLMPVRLPEALARDALLLPQGQSGLVALSGHRWAEPLADAVPRLLRQDLSLLLGQARVWTAPLPSGVMPARLLRVEVLQLQAAADRRTVQLQARWSLADAGSGAGLAAPLVRLAQIDASSNGPEPDALVAAHRLALWRLAEQIAAELH